MSDLSRRELLRLAACATALPGAAEFFSTWLHAASGQHASGFQPEESPLLKDYQPKFFDADDFDALQAFTAILIPADDTPGAREARCAHFIDFVLQASTQYAPDTGRQWREAMRSLEQAGFHAAEAAGRAAIVEAISRPERDRRATHPAYAAYRLIKQQNTFAFYTSRVGMIECLEYKGNAFNASFPACEHQEHRTL
jgi:hypothetical protein